LPQLLNAAFYEMLPAANHSWTMYPGILHGAVECLSAHGSDTLKERYLADIISGETLATMCITEAHAGSDVSLLRTQAVPVADGADEVKVTGSKIFISGGEHNLTANIVHLVLARLPGAPAGNRGLSLVLVPKILPDGTRNNVRCDGIEKKMGLKASATCVMSFDGATGWLIGKPNRGLSAMFVMMNSARLHVALQGLGHLEAATQNAIRYAAERQQMRAVAHPDGVAPAPVDPIALHPAMRRKLLRLEALTQGGRVLAYWAGLLLDEHDHHPDADRRERGGALASLLTPILKSFLTESGHYGADDALQVWGGYGYIHEYGIEQAVRDSRVAMIYEGTNEIQAIDLLLRKVLADDGARLTQLEAELRQEIEACRSTGDSQLEPFAVALAQQLDQLRAISDALLANHAAGDSADREWPLRVADDYLKVAAYALLCWAWARSARLALPQAGSDTWYRRKFELMRFALDWVLPEVTPFATRARARDPLPWLPLEY
ncbi:MAG: acyl-CoA dehydrogenase family protein, partial [Spongiibacteraceae bacterium]|jgi:alkylation response protein AidB-like acyl-CoA dehydrogenase|nr:acyl-CoA dehydrogenase family protein [Spongiibacteraceae bacterium]